MDYDPLQKATMKQGLVAQWLYHLKEPILKIRSEAKRLPSWRKNYASFESQVIEAIKRQATQPNKLNSTKNLRQ
jgi:hypothetical protein